MTDELVTEAILEPEATAGHTENNGETKAQKQVKALKGARRRKRGRASKLKGAPHASPSTSKRSFPASTFEEALELPLAIQKFASGQPIRRLTLFNQLQKSPESGPSRQLITNSHRYGLTKGSYISEILELTQDGAIASSSEVPLPERLRTRFKLAMEEQPPFKSLYDKFKGNKLPSHAVLRDAVADLGIEGSLVQECVDTFILNAKFLAG